MHTSKDRPISHICSQLYSMKLLKREREIETETEKEREVYSRHGMTANFVFQKRAGYLRKRGTTSQNASVAFKDYCSTYM